MAYERHVRKAGRLRAIRSMPAGCCSSPA